MALDERCYKLRALHRYHASKVKAREQLAISLFEKWRAAVARGRYVRFGSIADMLTAHPHVRLVPIADNLGGRQPAPGVPTRPKVINERASHGVSDDRLRHLLDRNQAHRRHGPPP